MEVGGEAASKDKDPAETQTVSQKHFEEKLDEKLKELEERLTEKLKPASACTKCTISKPKATNSKHHLLLRRSSLLYARATF